MVLQEVKDYTFVDNDKIKIFSTVIPDPYARVISPFDSAALKKEKEAFPYKLKSATDFKIIYKGKEYLISFEEGFIWDGASIPSIFWILIGPKGAPEFLIASMVHDKICNNHKLVNGDRYLSSLIFRELLISCGVPVWRANSMFFAVDNFQKFQNW